MSPTTRGWCVPGGGTRRPREQVSPWQSLLLPRDEGIDRVYLGWACHLARPAHVQTFASGPSRRCEKREPAACRSQEMARNLPRARLQDRAHQPHRHSVMGRVRAESEHSLKLLPAPRGWAPLITPLPAGRGWGRGFGICDRAHHPSPTPSLKGRGYAPAQTVAHPTPVRPEEASRLQAERRLEGAGRAPALKSRG